MAGHSGDAGVVETAKAFIDGVRGQPDGAVDPARHLQHAAQDEASDAVAGDLLDPRQPSVRPGDHPRGLSGSREIAANAREKHGLIPVDEFKAALKDPASIGAAGRRPRATSRAGCSRRPTTFEPDATAAERARADGRADDHERARRARACRRTQWRDVLTKASHRRGARRSSTRTMPKVARAIENRLDQRHAARDRLHRRLRGSASAALTTTAAEPDAEQRVQHLRAPGLPPGPIASPGDASIEAVLHPADGHWLYFVTVNPTPARRCSPTRRRSTTPNVEELQAW